VSDFDEQALRARLDARARTVSAADDWDDLLARMTRRNRRTTRALAFALSILVIAGAAGIVVAARGTSTPTKAKPVAAPRDRVDVPHTPVPTWSNTVNAASAGFGQSQALVNRGSTGTLGVVSDGVGVPSGSVLMLASQNVPMARVFTRTTADGLVIRAYRADVDTSSEAHGPPWWTPPGYCYPNGYVQADVSNEAIAGVAYASLYAAQPDGAKVGGQYMIVGRNEQSPRWIVIAQGPSSAARLRATFPDGSRDEMAPVGGVAVLAGTGSANPTNTKVTITALDASGAELGSATLPGEGQGAAAQYDNVSCAVPQTLPAPGKEQPADVTAAHQAVVDAFNGAYAKGVDDSAFDSYFVDSHGFDTVRQQLRNGPYKEQVKTATMKLNDVVFLDATTAAIQYEIDIPNYATPSFPNRFNEAHLVNGTWKLDRQGWCNDVSLAGLNCPP